MPKDVPSEFWAKYSNLVDISILADLKRRMESAAPSFLTIEAVRGESDTSIQAIRALLDDLVVGGYVDLEKHQRCSNCQEDLSAEAIEVLRCSCGETFSDRRLPEITRTYVRHGMRSRDVRWAITIHGMNTAGVWQQDFSWRLTQVYGYSIPVGLYKYGNVKLAPFLSFLRGRHRRQLLEYFRKVRREMVASGRGERPDVVAHSFGTWLLSQVLTSDISDDPICVGRVILTGSIVRPDFDWESLIKQGRVEAVLCHMAIKDVPARFTHWFIRGTGPSCVQGFNDRSTVQYVISPDFGHSDYFVESQMGSVLIDQWAPFLTSPIQTFSASPLEVGSLKWKASRMRFLTLPLPYIAMLILVALSLLMVICIYLGSSQLEAHWKTLWMSGQWTLRGLESICRQRADSVMRLKSLLRLAPHAGIQWSCPEPLEAFGPGPIAVTSRSSSADPS